MPDVPVLLLIPPLTQLNTPYPSTAYLTGFLRAHGYTAAQADVGIEMVLALLVDLSQGMSRLSMIDAIREALPYTRRVYRNVGFAGETDWREHHAGCPVDPE